MQIRICSKEATYSKKLMKIKYHTKQCGRNFIIVIAGVLICVLSYIYGIYSYTRNLWPLEVLRGMRNSTPYLSKLGLGNYDDLGRLNTYPNKIKVSCSQQSKDMGVLLVAGQSNSANFAEKKYATNYPNRVLNYHNGECFVAESPLLGSTGENGEFITLLADKLIKSGAYESVVIISTGFDGSHISRWEDGGDLNHILLETISKIKNTR